MITSSDLRSINTEYFRIIETSAYFIVLKSKNTGHFWHLLEREAAGHRTFLISHKHHESDPFHTQANRPSISACCKYIKGHDIFHLERTRKKKERSLHRTVVPQ